MALEIAAMFMFGRFTDRARKVMQLANKEAQRLNHEYIGTEHILLGLVAEGLIKEGAGVAAHVLKNLDIDLGKIRTDVEKVVQSGPDKVTAGKLPKTPRAKMVIEYSIEEARDLNHNYVGTEHLLLGLVRDHEGLAGQVLINLGLSLAVVREEVLKYIASASPRILEQAARRMGVWVRLHPGVRIFSGALTATLIGGLIGVNLSDYGSVNSGALAGALGFLISVLIHHALWSPKGSSK